MNVKILIGGIEFNKLRVSKAVAARILNVSRNTFDQYFVSTGLIIPETRTGEKHGKFWVQDIIAIYEGKKEIDRQIRLERQKLSDDISKLRKAGSASSNFEIRQELAMKAAYKALELEEFAKKR